MINFTNYDKYSKTIQRIKIKFIINYKFTDKKIEKDD